MSFLAAEALLTAAVTRAMCGSCKEAGFPAGAKLLRFKQQVAKGLQWLLRQRLERTFAPTSGQEQQFGSGRLGKAEALQTLADALAPDGILG